MRHPMRVVCVFLCALLLCISAVAETPATPFKYQKAPDVIRQMLDAPPTPTFVLSPTRDRALLVDSLRQPPISDLAAPMLRLAGLRINPATNGRHHPPRHVGLRIVTIPQVSAENRGANLGHPATDGKETKVAVPANALLSVPEWSNDGKRFAFANTTANAIELYVGDAQTGTVKKMTGITLNGVVGDMIQWMPDNRTLLVQTIVKGRGTPPKEPAIPDGPVVQESAGKPAPVRTYEDLLQNPHDEDLFDFYATTQLAFVDVTTGKATPYGKPGIFQSVQISPDGNHLLVQMVHRPYTYLMPVYDFPRLVEVWDRAGKTEYKLADLPLAEHVPIEGVLTGPRQPHWRPTTPATLVWVEALDEGNPKKKVPFRDKLMTLAAPFTAQPKEFAKTEHRFARLTWGEKDLAFLSEFDRQRRWTRSYMLHVDDAAFAPKLVWDRSSQDRYNDPGTPLMRSLPNGQRVMWQNSDAIFLVGEGSSDQGDRPFLDRFDLKALKAERLFRCGETSYERPTALLAEDGSKFLTRYETATEPPKLFHPDGGRDGENRADTLSQSGAAVHGREEAACAI